MDNGQLQNTMCEQVKNEPGYICPGNDMKIKKFLKCSLLWMMLLFIIIWAGHIALERCRNREDAIRIAVRHLNTSYPSKISTIALFEVTLQANQPFTTDLLFERTQLFIIPPNPNEKSVSPQETSVVSYSDDKKVKTTINPFSMPYTDERFFVGVVEADFVPPKNEFYKKGDTMFAQSRRDARVLPKQTSNFSLWDGSYKNRFYIIASGNGAIQLSEKKPDSKAIWRGDYTEKNGLYLVDFDERNAIQWGGGTNGWLDYVHSGVAVSDHIRGFSFHALQDFHRISYGIVFSPQFVK